MADFDDDFAADFHDGGGEEEQQQQVEAGGEAAPAAAAAASGDGNSSDSDDSSSDENETDDKVVVSDKATTEAELVAAAARPDTLRTLPSYRAVLARCDMDVEPCADADADEDDKDNENADQNVVEQCNDVLARIESAVDSLHHRAVRAYEAVFPELSSLVPDALQFARVVAKFGRSDEADLADILPSAQLMVVKVSKANSKTRIADADAGALTDAISASEEILKLEKDRAAVLTLVEKRMQRYAPNLCQLVGSRCASLLVGLAGGLDKLAALPSSFIQCMGRRRINQAATSVGLVSGQPKALTRHAGILVEETPLIVECPAKLRRKAMRIVAGRVGLCARVDHARRDREAKAGAAWRADVERKIAKLKEPGQGRMHKPLPVPDAQKRKRRGGKLARKRKERLGLTDARSLANRISTSGGDDEDYDVSAMGQSLGMLSSAKGSVRTVQAKDTQRLADKAAAKRKLRGINAAGSGSAGVSGFTSLAFTPVMGLELGARTTIGGGAVPPPALHGGGGVGAAPFRVPPLPVFKKP